MTVDPSPGVITWSPPATDLGTQGVTLRVEDSRGGFAEQRYVVTVTVPPPNRPPWMKYCLLR